MNSDLKELFESLNSNNVRYIIAGAHALARYTPARYTDDFDIWVEPTEENVARLATALESFGVQLSPKQITQMASETRTMFTIGSPPFAVDFLNFLSGLTFSEAWANRITDALLGVQAPFLSKQDLIQTKRATGRPKDLVDLKALESPET